MTLVDWSGERMMMINTKPESVYGGVCFISVCTHPPARERSLQSDRNEGNEKEERERW